MRHVKRLARQTRSGVRRPAQPRWRAAMRRMAIVVVGLGLVGFAADRAWQAPATARLLGSTRERLIRTTADAGFVVGRVYSEGRTLADEKSLRNALEPYYGRPILSVDLDELNDRIENVPWVRSASISRQLPDTLWVRLDEHRPIARWMDGNRQVVLVSDAGEVVRGANAARFRGLPLLFGKGAPGRAAELLRLVAGEPALAARVTGARLVGERRWDVHLDGRVEVRLPAAQPEAAWRRLAAEERASAVLGRAITAVDLRHPDWLTLRIADQAIRNGAEPGA
jgi:cell division protein FtsQ